MTRLPMSKQQHWDILNRDEETKLFRVAESEVIGNLEDIFGFQIDGCVDDIKVHTYAVGFDLNATVENDDGFRNEVRNIFPNRDDELSYWSKATNMPKNNRSSDFEDFKSLSFTHCFRVDRSILPIILERFVNKGVFVEDVKESRGGSTLKKISTSESYIEKISVEMDAWDDLKKI